MSQPEPEVRSGFKLVRAARGLNFKCRQCSAMADEGDALRGATLGRATAASRQCMVNLHVALPYAS